MILFLLAGGFLIGAIIYLGTEIEDDRDSEIFQGDDMIEFSQDPRTSK